MNAWTPQGAPILTYARPRFAGYAHYERTGFWGSQKHLRVYPSGLLYQTFDEMKVENRGPVISVNEKALFFPVRPDQIEALSFVLVEFSGQRGDFRVLTDHHVPVHMYSDAHDFWFMGDGSSQEQEIRAALWEATGFEWAQPQGGVRVSFRSPYFGDLDEEEREAGSRLADRMTFDRTYVGHPHLWTFASKQLAKLKAKGKPASVLLRNGLVPYFVMDELHGGRLEGSPFMTDEMCDEVWNQINFMIPTRYSEYLGRTLTAEDLVPASDMAMWGYLANLTQWLKDNAPEALNDPLLKACGETCQERFRVA